MKRSLSVIVLGIILVFGILGGIIWAQRNVGLNQVFDSGLSPTAVVETISMSPTIVSTIPEALKLVHYYEEGVFGGEEAIHSKGMVTNVSNGGTILTVQLDYQSEQIQFRVDGNTKFSEADFTLNDDGSIESISVMELERAQLATIKLGEYVRVTFFKSDLSNISIPLKELILLER